MNELIKLSDVESAIIEVRGQRLILDSDVARLYGVETKRINEAVRNNPEKFPEGYIITIDAKELASLRSKYSTANISSKTRVLPKAESRRNQIYAICFYRAGSGHAVKCA